MACTSWGYTDNGFGPHRWKDYYKAAKGNLQSPVDIFTSRTGQDNTLEPLEFHYKRTINSTITNDGRSLQVTLTSYDSGFASLADNFWFLKLSLEVTGGPLSENYRLAMLRFHWGNDHCSGSEHSIDGQHFPLEVQLIHWNRDLYKNIGEAMTGESGLCIISVLFQISDEDNEGLSPITGLLARDDHKGRFSLEVKAAIDPISIIHGISEYWTYPGSLTTPPLTENVTWIICKKIMSLSERQIGVFRNVRNSSGESMANQRRPTCPLNERTVRASRAFNAMDETNDVNNYKDDNNNNNNNVVDQEENKNDEEQGENHDEKDHAEEESEEYEEQDQDKV